MMITVSLLPKNTYSNLRDTCYGYVNKSLLNLAKEREGKNKEVQLVK